jgi:non-ribosomal peptide synthetase component F
VPVIAPGGKRATIRVDLPSEVRAQVEQVRRQHRVTPNMVVLAMWGILALDQQKKPDCVLGCVVHGRSAQLKGINTVAGVCSNTVPVVFREAMPLQALLSGMQRDVLTASGRSFLSLSDILATAGLSHHDLHAVVNFSIDRAEVDTVDTPKLPFKITDIRYTQAASFDAYLDVERDDDTIALKVHFDSGRRSFDESKVYRTCTAIVRAMREHPEGTVRDVLDALLLQDGAFTADFDFGAERAP